VLEAKGLGARRLDLLFHWVDNRIEAVRIGIALPWPSPSEGLFRDEETIGLPAPSRGAART
jgi:hypothetical protein